MAKNGSKDKNSIKEIKINRIDATDSAKRIAVIGGGPAGMLAAAVAAKRGNQVVIFEKNSRFGVKLSITGKGRCNITNATDPQSLIDNIPRNHSFLYSSFYGFDNMDVMELFEWLGVPVKVERGKRVFPVSDKANDVVEAMITFMKAEGVELHSSSAVTKIDKRDELFVLTINKTHKHEVDKVIMAAGGLSFPATGSNGDGFKLARTLSHSVTPLSPALAPLIVQEDWVKDLEGLSLRNISITVKHQKKQLYDDFGELVFTKNGVSGPVILSASSYVDEHLAAGLKPTLHINLKPGMDGNELDKRVLRDFGKYSNRDFINSLDELLPRKLIPVIVRLSGVPPETKIHDITKESRVLLCRLLSNLTLTIDRMAGFSEAIVTRGGVCVDEIDPGTMESKLTKGLYFAGEIIDVDGFTGGFNLQIAFSTGYAAGMNV